MQHLRLSAAAFVLLPLALGAQRVPSRDAPWRSDRGAAGASFVYGRPTGEFLDNVQQGFGFNGFFRWNIDRQGIFSIRADGSWLSYGRETKRVPLSSTLGRINVDLTTSNNIVALGLGPQLTAPSGPIRPYANASVGASYFFTESSVEGSNNNNQPFANTTNYDDVTFAWTYGGGLLIPFGARQDISLDLGARMANNGQVKYLRKGGITDLPNGDIVLHPIQSDANLVVFHIGISAAIR
jgi:hypothetical protein